VSWGPGRFDVFAVDGEDKLRHWWYQRGGGSGLDHADMSLASEQQGTTVISAPAASSASSNTLEVVAVCSANEVVVDGTVRNGQFIEHWTWS
jgi:hypothetical protein